MKKLLSVLCALFISLPLATYAAAPFVVVGLVGVGVIAGFSIYRGLVPVNMADAFNFFSTCWSCQIFGDIMRTMSDILPRAYNAIGDVLIPAAITLTAIWFAWKLFSGYINSDPKNEDPWNIAGAFGTHMLKLGLVLALLAFPLPRLISNVALEPIFSIGLSLNRVVAGDEKFNECLIATTIADTNPDVDGAFSPKLRHNLACELANVHQMTAVGMTAGWTMLNMAFSPDYMHKAAFVPIFPNIPVFFAGLLILLLFFAALLPVPLYFLEVFIKLSLNLIMLPMFLLGWLFKGFEKIIPGNGAKSIQDTINELVQGVLGIAMIGIFISFSVMFLNAMFGKWQGANALAAAFANNDSRILMDGLTMNNDSIITIILMGLFIAMFMSMIPALVKAIFSINISDEYYKKAEKDVKAVWGNMKKWYGSVAKAVKK